MKRFLALITLFLLSGIVIANCGFSISSGGSKKTDKTGFPQMFELWEGSYKGTVKVFYGDGTDSRDYPAQFTVSRYSQKAVMTLKVPIERRTWSFAAKSSFYSTLTANISSVSVYAGTTYSYVFNGTLEGISLTGSINIIQMSDRGNPVSQWNYVFDFTKEM